MKTFRIAFTGPECSGKTTLSEWLSGHLNWPLAPEFARQFLSEKVEYTHEDLLTIAQRQFELNHAQAQIICDTDLTVIQIWEEEKFKTNHDIIKRLVDSEAMDLYFLCKPDIPWVADPLRENPLDRMSLFNLYDQTLKALNRKFVVLSGTLEERKKTILEAIKGSEIQF